MRIIGILMARRRRSKGSHFGEKTFELGIPDRLKNDSGLWYPGKRVVRALAFGIRHTVAVFPRFVQCMRLSKPVPDPTIKHSIQSLYKEGVSLSPFTPSKSTKHITVTHRKCRTKAKYVAKYNRHYCPKCKEYAANPNPTGARKQYG